MGPMGPMGPMGLIGPMEQKAKYHEKGDLETQLRAFTQEMVTNWY